MKTTKTVPYTNIQDTMERLYKIDELMYYRLRLMLDGVWYKRDEKDSQNRISVSFEDSHL